MSFATKKSRKATPVDEVLSKLPADQRKVLQSLREVVLSIMPDAEEVISYGVPMFKHHGKGVIAMSAKKNYCSLHLMSPPLAKAMASELKKYLKGVTLHFTPDNPLPVSLVKKIVRARLKEMEHANQEKVMRSKKPGFTAIDAYIAAFPQETQKRLEQVRATIRAVAPKAKEKISYQIAAFELNGKNLIHFAGWKNHISIYPIPSGTEAFNNEVAQYADGKGTLKFQLDNPLPLKLISQIVRFRIADNLRNTKTKHDKKK
jgi:uncharacterized protein YdhG (YjbR/CyaY superfamily)